MNIPLVAEHIFSLVFLREVTFQRLEPGAVELPGIGMDTSDRNFCRAIWSAILSAMVEQAELSIATVIVVYMVLVL